MSLGRKITEYDIGKSFKTRNGHIVEINSIEPERGIYPVEAFDITSGYCRFYVENGMYSRFKDERVRQYDIVECIGEEDAAPETPETALEEASVQKLTLTIPTGTGRLEGEFDGYRVTLEKL